MKIIFLDIDGVLNSAEYRNRMGRKYYSEIIDRNKMPLLKEIVEETGAKIVLSTSWRKFWNEGESQQDAVGQYINTVFQEFGLSVHSKTLVRENAGRDTEIREWLEGKRYIDGYVILDDQAFNWSATSLSHFVRTDVNGNGLEDGQVQTVIDVLNGKLLPVPDRTETERNILRTWPEKCWRRRK